MDGRGKRQAVAAIKVCLDSIGADALCRVEMNAHENGVAIRVCNCDARGQGDEDIAVPSHDHAISVGAEKILEALRDVKRHRFFRDFLARDPAAVMTTVAGIDYDGRGRITAWRGPACLCRRGSGANQSCNR
jgi:hypothetical protein